MVGQCENLQKMGVAAIPVGFFAECPACWLCGRECTVAGTHYNSKPMTDTSCDFNMKTGHQFRAHWGPVQDDAALPPNANLFVPNLQVIPFLR